MSTTLTLTLDQLLAHGATLGRELPHGSVIWLDGPLGAGKTTLVRAMLQGRGVTADAASPTYSLVHHHAGAAGDCYHLDCYRLRHPDEAADLDWETLLQSDLLLIEWPERAGAWAPRPTLRIVLDHAGDDHRTLRAA